MDIFTPLGLLLALVGIVGGMALEGSRPQALLQLTAFMIVILGSFGATLVSTLPSDVPNALRGLRRGFLPPRYDFHGLMEKILELADLARRDGRMPTETYG